MERIGTAPNYPGRVLKLRPDQIAQRATWGVVPDRDMANAASHVIHVVPEDGYTITLVNELDPGIPSESVGEGCGWREPDRGYGNCFVAGRCMR